MTIFPLPLFPEGTLASSVITTVWLGVFVVAFFNLRLGWTFSGLVVPGYLVPLLIVNPWSALVILLESILTYFLVWFASEYLSRWGRWSNFFGRDRFFALVLGSVIVRLGLDGWFLPWLGKTVIVYFSWQFDYYNQLHSFGLVIVALTANLFWKAGLGRGIAPLLVTVSLTYVLVRYLLMEFTNFNIGKLEYMYEGIARSFLASPKAYIILLTTAFFASRMNLAYSWEFNGILIPALLALQWYQPLKIVATFGESLIILVLARLVLRLPWLRESTIEGARKTVLFFNVAFFYKWLLGYLLWWLAPDEQGSDFYAFGYLVSTLIAIKMHDKGIIARLTRTTLEISLLSAVAATAMGFLLTLLPQGWIWSKPTIISSSTEPIRLPKAQLLDVLRSDKISLYGQRLALRGILPRSPELEIFGEGLRQTLLFIKDRHPQRLERARKLLAGVDYRIDEIQERYLYLRENDPLRGWGLYVFDLNRSTGLLVEVPAPLTEWATLEVGAWLFQNKGSALAIAGCASASSRQGIPEVLTNRQTCYHTFHKVVSRRDCLQVRGYQLEQLPRLPATLRGEWPDLQSSLWVKSTLPPSLNPAAWKPWPGDCLVVHDQPLFTNIQREATGAGFAELFLNLADRRRLLAKAPLLPREIKPRTHLEPIHSYCEKRLANTREESGYRFPQTEEMLFFDEEILSPLLTVIRTEGKTLSAEARIQLRFIAAAAALFQYQLLWYRHRASGQAYLMLAEKPNETPRRHWGTYIFRLGPAQPYLVQIPRPWFEPTVFSYGAALFDRLEGEALFIAGVTNLAEADVTQGFKKLHLFNLVHQVVLREAGSKPLFILQCRATATPPEADCLLALADGADHRTALSSGGRHLVKVLEEDQRIVDFVTGSAETMDYEAGTSPQTLYLRQSSQKEFALLWLSPVARSRYRQQLDGHLQRAQFEALGIPTVVADLYRHLAEIKTREGFGPVPLSLREEVEAYLSQQDMLALAHLRQAWSQWRMERLVDLYSQQSFLLIYDNSAHWPLVINLAPCQPGQATRLVAHRLDAKKIQQFVQRRITWLELRRKP